MQQLPLGDDCTKYLSQTPKAPHDIDTWMINPSTSNATLTARSFPAPKFYMYPSSRQADKDISSSNNLTVAHVDIPQPVAVSSMWDQAKYHFLFVALVTFLCLVSSFIAKSYPASRAAQFLGRKIIRKFIKGAIALDFFIFWLQFSLGFVIYELEARSWFAAANFVSHCRVQKVSYLVYLLRRAILRAHRNWALKWETSATSTWQWS